MDFPLPLHVGGLLVTEQLLWGLLIGWTSTSARRPWRRTPVPVRWPCWESGTVGCETHAMLPPMTSTCTALIATPAGDIRRSNGSITKSGTRVDHQIQAPLCVGAWDQWPACFLPAHTKAPDDTLLTSSSRSRPSTPTEGFRTFTRSPGQLLARRSPDEEINGGGQEKELPGCRQDPEDLEAAAT